jgi:hypothetical protein
MKRGAVAPPVPFWILLAAQCLRGSKDQEQQDNVLPVFFVRNNRPLRMLVSMFSYRNVGGKKMKLDVEF